MLSIYLNFFKNLANFLPTVVRFFRNTAALAVATLVSPTICKILPDHYKVQHAEGLFAWNSVVQDYEWRGVLVIRRFVAENEMEVVAESEGRDENRRRIVRFLGVDKP